jgi:hypothetical protein
MVNISGGGTLAPDHDEVRLVESSRIDPGSLPGTFVNTLFLNRPLTFDHSGTGTGASTVASVAVDSSSSIGISYAVGDLVILNGGTSSSPAVFVVDSVVGLLNVVTSMHVLYGGSYSVPTGTTNIAITTNGHGGGLHVDVTFDSGSPATVTTLGTVGIDKTLTITGDVGVRAPITCNLEVMPGTSGVTFRGINYSGPDELRLDVGSSHTSFVNSILTTVKSPTPMGPEPPDNQAGNVLDSNVISGSVIMNEWKMPRITNNTFVNRDRLGSFVLEGTFARSPLIQGNTFNVDPMGGVAAGSIRIYVADDVKILNNSITYPSASSRNTAIEIFGNGIPGITPSVSIKNNDINSNGGTGIFIHRSGSFPFDPGFRVAMEGNDFHNNRIGVDISGDGTNAGNINIGDGTLTGSLGGNNFRGFIAAGVPTGSYAIYEHFTLNSIPAIPAMNNIWSVADPNTVIKDGTHNGPAGSSGLISVGSTQMTTDQQYVQTLYNHFLGRSGAVSELNGWVGALGTLGRSGVVGGIARSDEALTRIVDRFYLQFLDRAADSGGEAGWIAFLKHGGTEEQVISSFMTSLEYIDHVKDTFGGVDSSYIQSLYNRLLGRHAGSDEVSMWVSALPTVGRANIVNGFLYSAEYRTSAVQRFYQTLLHRPTVPGASEVRGWVGSSLDLLSIELIFATTNEYYQNG